MKFLYSKKIRGMSVVEVMVAIAIFSLLVGAGYEAFIFTNRLQASVDRRARALALAEEGIEAARSIRDQAFGSLSAGTKGLSLDLNSWQFSGSQDSTDGYIRKLVISSVNGDTMKVESVVDWNERGATSTVTLAAELTNWHKRVGMADGLSINATGAYITASGGAGRALRDIFLITDGSYSTTTITQIQASWSGVPSSRRLREVQIPIGPVVWSGNVASGSTLTPTNQIDLVGAGSHSVALNFNANMEGGSFNLVFTLQDGSTKSVTISNPPTQ